MACFGGIKEYRLIHLDFARNIYEIYVYYKDRRLTPGQRWDFIERREPDETGHLKPFATIFAVNEIVERNGFEPKRCDPLYTFQILGK